MSRPCDKEFSRARPREHLRAAVNRRRARHAPAVTGRPLPRVGASCATRAPDRTNSPDARPALPHAGEPPSGRSLPPAQSVMNRGRRRASALQVHLLSAVRGSRAPSVRRPFRPPMRETAPPRTSKGLERLLLEGLSAPSGSPGRGSPAVPRAQAGPYRKTNTAGRFNPIREPQSSRRNSARILPPAGAPFLGAARRRFEDFRMVG
jgi:hypothetical protein